MGILYITYEDEKVVQIIKENQELRIENKELKHRLAVYEDFIEVKGYGKPTKHETHTKCKCTCEPCNVAKSE